MEQDYLKSKLLYSPNKGVFYWIDPPSGHAQLLGEEAGTLARHGGKYYHVIKIDGIRYKRSRLAVLYMEGKMPPSCVDHISGDSTDDRWVNIRHATVTQNAWNHKGRKKKHCHLPMGVRMNPSGSYSARITVHKEQISLGAFATSHDAHKAYQEARRKYYGEFA